VAGDVVALISAVVTGAASGLGKEVARMLAAEGRHVVGVDLNAEALEAAAAEHGFEPLAGDVGDWATHERAADAAERAGQLAAWVNNAGIDIQGGAHEVTPAESERGLRVLLVGSMAGTAVAVRRMLPARAGSIVNVSSIQGIAAFPRYFVYGAAKAGLIQISRSVAVDYGPFGIRCNAVLPGTMDTPMTDEVLPAGIPREEALRIEGELAPMLRIAAPAEVAEAVCFLLSEKASYVTGTAVVVDGGAAARCYAYPPLEL
jgi:NAD(P)-dependent dehydrogenase (short-subunit alcohol dehydrogenase family)